MWILENLQELKKYFFDLNSFDYLYKSMPFQFYNSKFNTTFILEISKWVNDFSLSSSSEGYTQVPRNMFSL